jgi:hypothetical protein
MGRQVGHIVRYRDHNLFPGCNQRVSRRMRADWLCVRACAVPSTRRCDRLPPNRLAAINRAVHLSSRRFPFGGCQPPRAESCRRFVNNSFRRDTKACPRLQARSPAQPITIPTLCGQHFLHSADPDRRVVGHCILHWPLASSWSSVAAVQHKLRVPVAGLRWSPLRARAPPGKRCGGAPPQLEELISARRNFLVYCPTC